MTRIRYKKQKDGTLTASVNEYDITLRPKEMKFAIDSPDGWTIGYGKSKSDLMSNVKHQLKLKGVVFYDEVRRRK